MDSYFPSDSYLQSYFKALPLNSLSEKAKNLTKILSLLPGSISKTDLKNIHGNVKESLLELKKHCLIVETGNHMWKLTNLLINKYIETNMDKDELIFYH